MAQQWSNLQFVVCIKNDDYPASLESRKIYQVVPGAEASTHQSIRIREEQEKMKSMAQKALGKYGKPRLTLMELRAALDAQMGNTSLSKEIVAMREEGY